MNSHNVQAKEGILGAVLLNGLDGTWKGDKSPSYELAITVDGNVRMGKEA